jgi:endoglucanase
MVSAFSVRPDAAIIVDVSFAHTHDVDKSKYAALGKGVMLGYAPTLDRNLTDQLLELTKKEGIPVQQEVMGARTGTDADSVGIVGEGIPCTLLSIPQKYMHTPVEVVSLDDIRDVSQLMSAFILYGEVPSHD